MSILPSHLFSSGASREKQPKAPKTDQNALAMMALKAIEDGVIIASSEGLVQFINPAAAMMTGSTSVNDVLGLNYLSILRFENGEGMYIADDQNALARAFQANEPYTSREFVLVTMQGKKTPISITLIPTNGFKSDRIITFRNITKELEEEGEQTEFISTASHEMRTPVASIEGYIGLALNPQTATIDERARQYLTEAHGASQHLGRLFRDLLDVTKLDDNRIKVQLVPTNMNELVKSIADAHAQAMSAKNLNYSFGTANDAGGERRLEQLVYGSVDVDFLREILDNLIENAIKYTPEGGSIWVNVRGDGDRVLINVTDTGIGVAPEDLKHIFQKFYRVDNSQTRTIGGTGLGLYIAKERTEAIGGKIWAESAFGEGSTFYVSLPRMSPEDYQKRKQIIANMEVMRAAKADSTTTAELGQFSSMAASVSDMNTAQPLPTPQPPAPQPISDTPPSVTQIGETESMASPTQATDMSPEQLEAMKKAFAERIASQNAQINIQS